MAKGFAFFAGFIDVPVRTPPSIGGVNDMAALATFPATDTGWIFNETSYIPLVDALPEFTSPATTIGVQTSAAFGIAYGAPGFAWDRASYTSYDLFQQTTSQPQKVQGQTWYFGRLALNFLSAGGNTYQELGWNAGKNGVPYSAFHTTVGAPGSIPFNSPYAPQLLTSGNVLTLAPAVSWLIVGGTGAGAAGFNPIPFSPADPHTIYGFDPQALFLNTMWSLASAYPGMTTASYFVGSSLRTLIDFIDGSNRMLFKANINHGPEYWETSTAGGGNRFPIHIADETTLDNYVQSTGMDWQCGVSFVGWLLVFRGTSADGSVPQATFVIMDNTWEHYWILRLHPEDANASAMLGRGVGARWSMAADTQGNLWFNSGLSTDAGSVLVADTPLPVPAPAPQTQINLPCFNPCVASPG